MRTFRDKVVWITGGGSGLGRAIAKRRREFVFTGHGRLGAFLGMHFPGVVDAVGARIAGRVADNMAKGKQR